MNVFNYDTKLLSYNKIQKFNNNFEIIKLFQVYLDINKQLNEPFKVNAYKNAINNIKQLTFDLNLSNVIYLKKNKLVGIKLYDKIIEFLKTGTINSLIKLQKDNILLNIKGFGPVFIKKLNKMGIFTIQQIKENKVNLNHLQMLGIKYHKDLSKLIPRDQIIQIKAYFDKNEIFKNLVATLVGSFRRNQESSGDVDLVISCNEKDCLKELSNRIKSLPIYIDTLILGQKKFSFLINWKGIVRQVDMLLVDERSYYTALMHFTGNAQFNQKIRSILKKKGIKINEYYILLPNNTRIYPKSEEEIFKFIGIKYLEPSKRIPNNIKFISF